MSEYSPEIYDRLKALGIRPIDIRQALILLRDFRIYILKASINPKATRIAILFTELADRHFAQQKLTAAEMKELQEIAEALFKISKEKN